MVDYFDSDDDADLKDRSVSGTAFRFIGEVTTAVVGLVSIAVLARLLAPEAFGLTAMAFAVVGFVGIFSNMGLKSAIVQRPDLQPSNVSSVFWLNLGFAVFLIGVCIALAPLGAWFYDDWRIFGIIVVSSVQFLLSALKIQHRGLLERNLFLKEVMISNVAAAVVGQGSAIGLAWWGAGYWALVVGPLVGKTAEALVIWVVCGWRPGGIEIDEEVKSMISFGAYLSFSRLASFLNRNTDDVLLGRFVSAFAVGLYNRAYKIFTYPMDFVHSPITSVAIPVLSRLHGDDEAYRSTYFRVLSIMLCVTAGFGVLIAGAADYIVAIMLGPQWEQAGPILAILGVCVVFQPIGKTSGWIYTSQDRTDDSMRFSLFMSTPVTVASFIIGLPWGVIGVATSYAIASILVDLPLNVWMAHRRGPTDAAEVLTRSAPFIASAGFALGCLALFRYQVPLDSPLLGFTACAAIAAITYAAPILLFESTRAAVADGYGLAREQITKKLG